MNKIGLDWTSSAAAAAPIRRLLDGAREAGLPVFFTRYSLNEDYSDAGLLLEVFPQIRGTGGMVRGTWDAEVVDELAPQPEEVVIDKTRYSAFYETDLEEQPAGARCGRRRRLRRDDERLRGEHGPGRVLPRLPHHRAERRDRRRDARAARGLRCEDFRYSFGQVVDGRRDRGGARTARAGGAMSATAPADGSTA